MDGLTAASKIAGMGVKTPIIALTANVMSNDLEHYTTNGMSGFLGKPFTSQELWRCLKIHFPVESYSAIDRQQQSLQGEETQVKLRTLFVNANQNTYANITRALNTGDIKTAHRLVHTLKSNAGLIKQKRLQAIAAEAEKALSDDKNLLSDGQLQSLESELVSALEELAPLIDTESKKIEIISDTGKIHEIITELEPMLKNRSTKCLQLLDDINSIPGAEDLAFYVEEYNFKLALDALIKLKGKLGDI